jgi:hypothetical protein
VHRMGLEVFVGGSNLTDEPVIANGVSHAEQ